MKQQHRNGALPRTNNQRKHRTQGPEVGQGIRLGVRVFLLVLLQTTLLPRVRFFGAVPDILLAFVAVTAVTGKGTEHERAAVISGISAGFLADAIGGATSTGDIAEAIQQQALMCSDIQAQTDAAGKSTEEMMSKSEVTLGNVNEGVNMVSSLKEQAARVEEAGNQAAQATKQLSNRVEEVKTIVSTILSISSQTNLLALNASIEAARAGEAGRGFAVVADEIRQLSEQTKAATTKITDIIGDLNSDAEQAMDSIHHSSAVIKEQNEMIDSTKDKFDSISKEVSALTDVIADIENVIHSVLAATDTISENITHLSATSEEIAAASSEGVRTSQKAVTEMNNMVTLIDATYSLAQDLKESTV